MSNTNTSYQSAGEHATTARQEVKAWYKRPFALNATITVVVILTALWINDTFKLMSLPWKLLLGTGLIWGGGKLAGTQAAVAKTWSKIFRGLGAAIIILALLKSGVWHASESAINWVDKTLTELSGKTAEGASAIKLPRGTTLKVDYPTWKGGIGHSVKSGAWEDAYEISFEPGRPNTGMVWGVCPKVTKPAKLQVPMTFEWSKDHQTVQTVRFTEESRRALPAEYIRLGVVPTSIEIHFFYVEVPRGTTDVCSVFHSKLAG